jgi:pimeloyl-ACP methyl ester carboxylesterase
VKLSEEATVTVTVGIGQRDHGLVYVAAFAPDEGRAVRAAQRQQSARCEQHRAYGGRLSVDRSGEVRDGFRGRPAGRRGAVHGRLAGPDQRQDLRDTDHRADSAPKPSYGIVATQDRMINPNLERSMYKLANAKVTEIKGSHVVFISQPRAVADVIERAARGAQ